MNTVTGPRAASSEASTERCPLNHMVDDKRRAPEATPRTGPPSRTCRERAAA